MYGHSCLGAHGKRSNEPIQSIDSKLIPNQDFDKYSYQIPSLEGQMINDRLYNRLISYLRNSNINSASSSSLPFNYPMTSLNSLTNPLIQLNPIDQLSKAKRYEAGKLSLDDIRSYLKKSNDYVNKNIKKSTGLDDYSESNY